MLIRTILAAAVLLAATPALAQQAPGTPPGPPIAPAAPAEPTPEQMAVITRAQAAGEALQTMMDDLEPRAEAVRDDTSLTDAEKETRIRAMIAEHQPVIDEFTTAVRAMILLKAASEGASPEEAAQASAMIGDMVSTQIAQSLITGEDPDGDEDAGE